jgi:Ca2+-binding RTX toxin-like protein
LNVSSNNYIGSGQTSVALLGGLGNDRLSVTDSMAGDTGNQGQNYGVAIANLNGGDGDDILSVGGVLKATLTGGAGADAFMLTAQQYRTLLEGTRAFAQTNGTNAAVTADPVIITDLRWVWVVMCWTTLTCCATVRSPMTAATRSPPAT